ncbi:MULTISPECIES: helix-turn-helix domain-containing protein [Vibrio]|nr:MULTISPECIES: helix-turn-helix transcriptional regulator [Vibrio]UIJ40443.1 helix-turn-helix transcriptional regulator [Vibrio kanaloae]
MNSIKLKKQTSLSTVIADFLKQLRLYGADYVRSGGDISKVDPDSESQESVAEALKITKAAYSKIESGDIAITIFNLGQLCIGYGITLGELMTCVDKKTQELKKDGIDVINAKITLRLDYLRWKAKIEEKSEAAYNKAVRELRKNKTYSLYTAEQLEELRLECRKKAKSELEKKHDLGVAISEQSFGMV